MHSEINVRKKAVSTTSHSIVPCLVYSTTTSRTISCLYTNVKFWKVQKEQRRKGYCYPTLLDAQESLQTYIILEDVRVGDGRENIIKVSFFGVCVCVLLIRIQRNCV